MFDAKPKQHRFCVKSSCIKLVTLNPIKVPVLHYRTKLSNQVRKIKAKKQLFLTLKKEYFILSKLFLAKISQQRSLDHKAQQTETYNY